MRLSVLSLLLVFLLGCKTESHTHLIQHVPVFTNTVQLTETEISYTPEDTSEAPDNFLRYLDSILRRRRS
jgi:hypothetical protein